jgi:D-inositol-3-phosphate glycosyltransferase
MTICMLAGNNSDYIYSIVQALTRQGMRIELIGGDAYENSEYSPCVTFINLRGSQDINASVFAKTIRILRYYIRFVTYVWKNDFQLLHIQAFRFNFIEGVILVFIYKILGKKIIYTAHNVQPKGKDNKFIRFLFRVIYSNVDHIICHTKEIKDEIVNRHTINNSKLSVIQRGLNSSVPITQLSPLEARNRLGVDPCARVLLMFGVIRPDKGYEIAMHALRYLCPSSKPVLLIIAGRAVTKRNQYYLNNLKRFVVTEGLGQLVQFYDYYIPDSDVELFFKGSDTLLLPYTEGDFQSGILFLAYRFGLPIIASNIGSFPKEIENGARGYIFKSENPEDLAAQIDQFYQNHHRWYNMRQHIMQYGREKYSWDYAAERTVEVYKRVIAAA